MDQARLCLTLSRKGKFLEECREQLVDYWIYLLLNKMIKSDFLLQLWILKRLLKMRSTETLLHTQVIPVTFALLSWRVSTALCMT